MSPLIKLQAIYYLVVGRPHSAWLVLGTGIRLSQDVGAHRASFAETRRPLEAEMWKRVFWYAREYSCSRLALMALQKVFCVPGPIPRHTDRSLADGSRRAVSLLRMTRPSRIILTLFHSFDLELPSEPVLEGSIERHKLEYFNSSLRLGWYSSMAQRALLNWRAFYKVYGYFSTKEEVVARVDSLLQGWEESLPDRRMQFRCP